MKKYIPLLTLVLVFLPGAAAHAANLPLLDPNFSIVPEACRVDCPCGVGAALQFIQNIMNVLISFAVIIMSLIIAWAGFLFVMSAANPESRSKARGMLINAFIGLFIVLSAWLIVDFIMKRLYGDGSTAFGPWNKILVLSGDQCIVVNNNLGRISGLPGLVDIGVNGVPGGTAGSGAPGYEVGGSGSNCTATESQVVPIPTYATDGGPNRRDLPDTVQRFMNMRAAAKKAGITLQAGNAYRSDAEEVSLWNSHGCSRVGGQNVCTKGSQVAWPCALGGNGSNHTKGTAIDIQTDPAGTTWMVNNAANYGFLQKIASERWHWSDTGY